MTTRAVFFDVDFTLIYPGPSFQGPGYQAFCAGHGVHVDPARFDAAVAGAAALLAPVGDMYDGEIFVRYTRRIIEGMGGSGAALERAARDIYEQWAACHHFHLYDDVAAVLRGLHGAGLRIGLISNTQRCLRSFQEHFALEGLFSVALSSADHGYMKPHRRIFEAALSQAGVAAAEAVMVGDSLAHDIEGAQRSGMRAVLVARGGAPASCPPDVPVISTLRDLPALL